jgi:uncharacterized repeat protein (TIGR04076 family)
MFVIVETMLIYDVKITVLKTTKTNEIFDQYAEGKMTPQCDAVKEGAVYISKSLQIPAGFCSWAWSDIQRDVTVLALGGDFPWIKQKGVMISSCTDGLRPVIFKLERMPIHSG